MSMHTRALFSLKRNEGYFLRLLRLELESFMCTLISDDCIIVVKANEVQFQLNFLRFNLNRNIEQ